MTILMPPNFSIIKSSLDENGGKRGNPQISQKHPNIKVLTFLVCVCVCVNVKNKNEKLLFVCVCVCEFLAMDQRRIFSWFDAYYIHNQTSNEV